MAIKVIKLKEKKKISKTLNYLIIGILFLCFILGVYNYAVLIRNYYIGFNQIAMIILFVGSYASVYSLGYLDRGTDDE